MLVFLIIIVSVAVACGLFVLLVKSTHLIAKMAVVVAWFSLVFSLFAAFKAEIFPFDMKVLVGDIILTHIFEAPDEQVGMILPVSFINDSYAEGIVEGLVLKIIDKNKAERIFKPLMEIDYIAFVRGEKEFHPDNISSSFMQFPLHSKQSILKYILFFQEFDDEHPITPWVPGEYAFALYAKSDKSGKFQKEKEFTLNIGQENLDRFSAGKTCSIGQERIGM